MKPTHLSMIFLSVLIALFLFACTPQNEMPVPVTPVEDRPATPVTIEVEFTLQTIAENGKLLYIGVGGEIDGIINPDLIVQPGAIVRIVLINGDGMVHDLFLPDFNTKTDYVKKIGDQTDIVFEVGNMQPGAYAYYCTLPGHRQAGQEGKLIVESSNIPTGTPHQLGEVKTYRDEIAGFSLDYPATWFVEADALQGAAESAVYTVSLFSWDRKIATPSTKDLNTLPEGATKIDITVFNQGPATLAEAVQQFRNQDSGTPVVFLKEETWTLANNQETAYLESENAFGVVATMITMANGKVVYVSGYGNLTLFKAIAFTFRIQ